MPKIIPYGRQWIDESDIDAVVAVLRSDFLTQGPAVEEFERKICEMTGAEFCVAFSNATAALQIAVASLELAKGDEGITSPITFVASANCLAYNGLCPVFADVDPETGNIDVLDIERRLTPRTKVLIPVDFAGRAVDIEAISNLAAKHHLNIIEDAAHAIGSQYADGRMIGCCHKVNMTVFSFHPVKTITTGEGGAVTTNDPLLADKLRLLRSHGIHRDPAKMEKNPGPWYYEMIDLGYNFRMTDMQAALGKSQLGRLNTFRSRRQAIVTAYNQGLRDLPGVSTPKETKEGSTCFHLYVVQIDFAQRGLSRKEFMSQLREKGVGTQVHYIPVHTQPYYKREWGYREGDFPVAEGFYEGALSLPLYPQMTENDVQQVIHVFKEVLK